MLDRLHDLLHDLLAWVEGFAATPYGDWALFGIAFAESSFFPVPPDVLLIALCLGQPDRSLWFAFLCSLGSVLGGIAGYAIGYWGGRPILRRFFDPNRVAVVESFYDRYNAWATGIAGLTPLPYKIFTIAGGAFAVNLKIFVVASIIARSLRFFAVSLLIYFYGAPIRDFIERYLNVLSIAFVVLLVAGWWVIARGVRKVGEERRPERTPVTGEEEQRV